jgi:hypothetical protein
MTLVDLIELSDGTIAALERVESRAQIVIWDNKLTTRHVVTHVQSNNYIKQIDQYTVCLYYANLTEFINLRDHSHKYVEQCHIVCKLKNGYVYGGKAKSCRVSLLMTRFLICHMCKPVSESMGYKK